MFGILGIKTIGCARGDGAILFHSDVFLLVFLPATLAGTYLFARHEPVRLWLLIAASLIFYGYWDIRLLPMLAGSIVVNWLLARLHDRHPGGALIVLGVAANLALLGVFKYADLAGDTVAYLTGTSHTRWNIVLPLAISFFTFQQISYLVDLKRGRAPQYGLRDYALYIAFFPQLIAGPIVRHHEIIGQFRLDPLRPGAAERLSRGLTLFAIGLAKKVMIADELVAVTSRVFDKALDAAPLTILEAWTGLLAYTFQLYFDFSGYSDMAIGLALMVGLTLPLNFDAPYKATTIRDFWRRWHMTLMRFMRDYLYRPIGLALHGALREPVAVMTTMTLVGLWHGASWTFALFGVIHGVALVINQTWHRAVPDRWHLPPLAGLLLTFGFFALSLSLFRSESVPASLHLLEALFTLDSEAGSLGTARATNVAMVGVAAAIAFFGRTSQELALERLKPGWIPAAAVATVILYAVLKARDIDFPVFIYFQF